MTTPVRDGPPPVPVEELVLGPPPLRRRLPRWVVVTAVGLGILIVLGAAVWRAWPRPLSPLSLSELEGVYAGMVRADGTNDASVLTRQKVAETPMTVNPPECSPLIQATMANRFPDAALDGVGTYWLGSSTISLFTMRFGDETAVEAELERISTTLDSCVNRALFVRPRQEAASRGWQATIGRTMAGSGDNGQLGYILASPDGVMAIQLMPYLNTLTWQYRYESGSTPYAPLAANQLMYSLHAQLDAVVAERHR